MSSTMTNIVTYCVIFLYLLYTVSCQWNPGGQDIMVDHIIGKDSYFQWSYDQTAHTFSTIRWSFTPSGGSAGIIMAISAGDSSPNIVDAAYNGRLTWDSSSPASMVLKAITAADVAAGSGYSVDVASSTDPTITGITTGYQSVTEAVLLGSVKIIIDGSDVTDQTINGKMPSSVVVVSSDKYIVGSVTISYYSDVDGNNEMSGSPKTCTIHPECQEDIGTTEAGRVGVVVDYGGGTTANKFVQYEGSGLSAGAIAGIVIGCGAGVALIIGGVVYALKRQKRGL